MSGRAGKWLGRPASAALALALLPAFPAFPALPAQSTHVTGQVLKADSTPVRGARVVLHQVGRQSQGPIDSTLSDERGRFSLGFRPDTSAFYLLSAGHAGIEYFSPPVPTNPARPDTGIRIVVYDTSSTAPVSLEARHLVLTRPAEDGSRSVLDLMVLRNNGRLTRVAPDTMRPSWTTVLPHGTSGLQAAEGDVSPEAMRRRGDTLVVTSPIAPGEKQLAIQYLIPAGRRKLEVPLEQPGLRINLLTEEPEVQVFAPGIAPADSQVIEGRSFRRWTGVVPRGGIRIILPDAHRSAGWVLAILVAGLGLALGGAGWYLLRRAQPAAPARADALIDAIASLDARYSGREEETTTEEWGAYQQERARLKAELESSLASGGWTR